MKLRCTPWILVKTLTLFLDRVFDAAEDFRLKKAVPVLVHALQGLRHDD